MGHVQDPPAAVIERTEKSASAGRRNTTRFPCSRTALPPERRSRKMFPGSLFGGPEVFEHVQGECHVKPPARRSRASRRPGRVRSFPVRHLNRPRGDRRRRPRARSRTIQRPRFRLRRRCRSGSLPGGGQPADMRMEGRRGLPFWYSAPEAIGAGRTSGS